MLPQGTALANTPKGIPEIEMRIMQKNAHWMALAFVVLLCARPSLAQDAAGEIALSDESIQLRYMRSREQAAPDDLPGVTGFGLYWNEQRDLVASAHYFVEASRLRLNRLSFQAGPVAYAAMLNLEDTDVFGLALAAEIRYQLLRNREVDIIGYASYAPDVLTFGSADRIWDVSVRAQVALAERIKGFGGYRLFDIDLISGRLELEETAFLGMRYEF